MVEILTHLLMTYEVNFGLCFISDRLNKKYIAILFVDIDYHCNL